MTHARASEKALTDNKSQDIEIFWTTVEQDTFITTDNITIAFAANFKRALSPYIVILPGRSESYLKYQELIYDFDKLGYDSLIIDHRGQGLSQRLVTNQRQGYVNNFDDYADDLHFLLNKVLPEKYPTHQQAPLLLAHSMGGAIALRYLQRHEHNFSAGVLTSPMIGIDTGGIPHWLASSIVSTGAQLNHWFSNNPWYFIGQTDNNTTSFEDNQLMHSPERFQRFSELYQQQDKIQLGGVTFQWLNQAIKAQKTILSNLDKVSTPLLVLQAGNERIVDNPSQDTFCQQLHQLYSQSCPDGKPIIFSGAYHELLFEIDTHRDKAINTLIAWFKKHQT